MCQSTIAIVREEIFEPVQRLHDAHRGTPCPIEFAGCGDLEFDRQVIETNRATARVRVDHDVRGDGSGQTEIIGGRHSIDEHAHLISAGEGCDQLAVVWRVRAVGERVLLGSVVESAVDATEVLRTEQPLESLIDCIAASEIEEIAGSPNRSPCTILDAAYYLVLEVKSGHSVRYLYHFFGRSQARSLLQESPIYRKLFLYTRFPI